MMMIPVVAVHAQFTYTATSSNTITITGYFGPANALIIPAEINGFPVTAIGDGAFDAYNGNTSPTSVTITNYVTSIGNFAFVDSTNLTNVIFGTNVTTIGNSAFIGIPNLSSLTIPNGIISIGDDAFDGCGLKNITIPNSIMNLGDYTFQNCSSLNSVVVGNNVTNIGGFAFSGCVSLTKITIGNNVTSIGKAAFQECDSLTNVVFPAGVSNILDDAFLYCGSLKGLYFSGAPPNLGFAVFNGVSDATVYYMPGATGWSSTFGGFQTLLWNPQVQTGDGQFGVRNNQFGFNVTGTTNIPVVVEACTNLASITWVPLQACTLTNGAIYFSDPQWSSYPSRFYRITPP